MLTAPTSTMGGVLDELLDLALDSGGRVTWNCSQGSTSMIWRVAFTSRLEWKVEAYHEDREKAASVCYDAAIERIGR